MTERERDFITLFNASWYTGYPIMHVREDLGRRAVWNIHIGSVVKRCADFFGYFTCFEAQRTDAVILKASGEVWARIEWEWQQPHDPNVNELGKLAKAAADAELLVFIGYSRHDHHEKNIETIQTAWRRVRKPLIAFLVTYEWKGRRRLFDEITPYYVSGTDRKVRHSRALVRRRARLPNGRGL